MLRIIIGILCATALVIAAPINDIGALKVVGNQIRGANGQPAQLMGMNFYHEVYDSPRKGGRDFVNRSVVESLAKEWRSSVVRFTTMYRSESGAGGEKGYDQDPTNAVKMVDSIVKAAIDYGIYVVVDWPHAPTSGGYLDQGSQTVAFFTDIAQRWGSYPNVIYELYDGPARAWWPDIKTYATTVIQAIREKDPDNLIIVSTTSVSQDALEVSKDPLKSSDGKLMSNVAYALHFYADHQDQQGFRANTDSAMALGVAFFVSEWGNSLDTGNGTLKTSDIDTFMNWMLEKKLSWCNWSLTDLPETSAALRNGTWNADSSAIIHAVSTTGNWGDGDLSQSGLFVRNKIIANRPAYNPTVSISMHPLKTSPIGSFSSVRTNAGIKLNLGNSHKWTSATLFDIKGAVVARAALTPDMSSTILKPHTTTQGLTIVQMKDAHGTSQTAKIK